MKKVVVALGLLASTIWLGACSKEEDEDEPTGLEYCDGMCESTTDCGVAGFDVEDCKEACEDAEEAASRAHCADEFDSAAKCASETYSCDPDPAACDDEYTDYANCLSASGS